MLFTSRTQSRRSYIYPVEACFGRFPSENGAVEQVSGPAGGYLSYVGLHRAKARTDALAYGRFGDDGMGSKFRHLKLKKKLDRKKLKNMKKKGPKAAPKEKK
jgi:hypothetical protein